MTPCVGKDEPNCNERTKTCRPTKAASHMCSSVLSIGFVLAGGRTSVQLIAD